jgi:hypothetical protein
MYLTQDKGGCGLKRKTLLTCRPRKLRTSRNNNKRKKKLKPTHLPKDPTRPSILKFVFLNQKFNLF